MFINDVAGLLAWLSSPPCFWTLQATGKQSCGVMHLRNQGGGGTCQPRQPPTSHLLPDDLDGVGPGPVPGSHVPVALGDGSGDGERSRYMLWVPDLESYLSQPASS